MRLHVQGLASKYGEIRAGAWPSNGACTVRWVHSLVWGGDKNPETWACERTQWVKALAARPDDLNLISGTQMVEGERWLF